MGRFARRPNAASGADAGAGKHRPRHRESRPERTEKPAKPRESLGKAPVGPYSFLLDDDLDDDDLFEELPAKKPPPSRRRPGRAATEGTARTAGREAEPPKPAAAKPPAAKPQAARQRPAEAPPRKPEPAAKEAAPRNVPHKEHVDKERVPQEPGRDNRVEKAPPRAVEGALPETVAEGARPQRNRPQRASRRTSPFYTSRFHASRFPTSRRPRRRTPSRGRNCRPPAASRAWGCRRRCSRRWPTPAMSIPRPCRPD